MQSKTSTSKSQRSPDVSTSNKKIRTMSPPSASAQKVHSVEEPAPVFQLSAEEISALKKYTEHGYVLTNGVLRGQCADFTKDEMETGLSLIEIIDGVFIKKAALGNSVRTLPVYRGVRVSSNYELPIQLQEGDKIDEIAYLSTSVSDYVPNTHYGFDGIVFEIDISDVNFIDLREISRYGYENDYHIFEDEILVDRDVQLVVVKDCPKRDKSNPYCGRYIQCKAHPMPRRPLDVVKQVADSCST